MKGYQRELLGLNYHSKIQRMIFLFSIANIILEQET
jgi:hypothetical protein